MAGTRTTLTGFLALFIGMLIWCGSATAAGIRVAPSSQRVLPGEEFYLDILAEGIPAEGLGGVQFRLNVSVPGGTVSGVADLGQAGANEVAVASPLLVSPPTPSRSGVGDFFWSGRGNNGILVMDNEPLANGSALYTFAHTNGSTPPAGSGSVARFMVRVASGVNAKQINVSLSDVMLLDGGPFYPLDYTTGATVQIGCFTRMPDLAGLGLAEATHLLAQSNLILGSTYEIDNPGGTRRLNVVLEQSSPTGSELLCETPVNLAVNIPPAEVTGGSAADKPGDDSGAVILAWTPAVSVDTAGYRVYLGSALLRDIQNPAANSAEIGGLTTGVTSQLRVTSYDVHGNESQGVTIAATPLDDVPPVVTVTGVTEGAYYRTDVTPQVSVFDTNLAGQAITLNGTAYQLASITADGAYTLTVTGTDRSGNQTTKSVRFTVDKTAPTITVANVSSGGFYNVDVVPTVTVTDVNLKGSTATLNGQPYASGTPLTAEGAYTLAVSAEDLAGNTATQTVNFIIDKTPPVSTVTVGSPRYFANGNLYVSGRTDLTISANDSASGVKISEYGIDNAAFGGYGAPFNLASLPDGGHTIAYRSIDNVSNLETSKQLDVILDKTPPKTVITASDPLVEGAVNTVSPKTTFTLAATDNLSGVKGIWYRIDGGQWQLFSAGLTLAGIKAGAHTISFSASDNVGNDEAERSVMVRLILTEVKKGISLEPVVLVGAWTDNLNKIKNQGAIDSLKPILSSLGISFHIADNGDDFKNSLRSGRYTTFILADYKDEKVGGEIREAVNYGDSLIFIKTRPSADPVLDEVFGVKFTGKTTSDNLPVNFQESPLGPAVTMPSSGKSVVGTVVANTAQVFGQVDDKHNLYPALVFNEYGSGKVILYTFDLLSSPDKQKVADLLGNSIALLKPEQHKVRALDSVPVRVVVSNSTEPLGLQITETIPAGTTADTITPQGVATDTTITWQQYLQASTKAEFGYYLNLPDAKGEYTAVTDVSYANYGDYRLYDTTKLTSTVQNDAADLLQTVIAELNGVPVAGSNDLAVLTDAVGRLSQVTVTPLDGKDAEKGVEAVTAVTKLLRGLSADMTDIRLRLDELLKILERKWYLINVREQE